QQLIREAAPVAVRAEQMGKDARKNGAEKMPAPTVNIFAPSAKMFSFVTRCSALLLLSPEKPIGRAASGCPARHASQRFHLMQEPESYSQRAPPQPAPGIRCE